MDFPVQQQDTYSDYIVYVDESGDHGLTRIDPQYPVFVLAFCIFRIEEYRLQTVPGLQAFKFQHFGHDMVVLHERDIRKAAGDFSFLVDTARRDRFMSGLSGLIDGMQFTLVASVIQKLRLCERYQFPRNPYHVALAFGLERVYSFLRHRGQHDRTTFIVFESRGKREDEELECEFTRVCDGANYNRTRLPFRLRLGDKRSNCCGLQLADLVARPIGRRMMNPAEPNRAYDIIARKFYRSGGVIEGRGLKVFP